MRKWTRIFLLLSVTIAILDGVFVLMNNAFTTDALHENLHTEGRRLHSSFDTLLAQTYTNMLTMATFISHDKEVQSLFLAGKKAVEIEGGGAGGPRADAVRKRLFDQVGPNWKEVQKDRQVRQLHFHLGPGSTSFLRVHRPDKFGDNMDNVRFTIVDTNAEQQPRVGFETGRLYSGLRGVVPVSTWDPDVDKMVHVGALEVGTSFSVMLDILDQRNDVGAGIFLTMDHVTKAMWPDFVKRRFGVALDGCDCVLEASTRDGIDNILNKMFEEGIRIQNHGTEIIHLDDTFYAVSHFPLRDYAGNKDTARDAVGSVLFWRNVDEQMATFNRSQLFNIIYGLLGFLLIELLLFFAFRFAMLRLEGEVTQRTLELNEMKDRLSDAQRIAHLGNWEWNVISGELWWSDETYRIFGVEPQAFVATIEAFMAVVHPDDRDRLLQNIDDALHKDKPYRVEHRVTLPDGGEKVVLEQGEGIFDDTGKPLQMRGTIQDITELKHAEDALRDNRQQLKSEIAIKNRLFSLIAHDLRAPFNTLLGMTHIMSQQANDHTKEEMVEFAKHINEAGKRVFELLRNLLDWSYLQMQGASPELEEIPLRQIVEETLDILLPAAQEKGVRLINKIDTTTVFSDRNMVQTIIRNFISNSLKFTTSGGLIEVLARQDGTQVHVTVTDTGVGMSDEQMAHVFALDKKTSTVGTAGEKGTGLGLPFCKEIAEKGGGSIEIESSPGKGSAFTLTIPSMQDEVDDSHNKTP